jgi:hypothetical protein
MNTLYFKHYANVMYNEQHDHLVIKKKSGTKSKEVPVEQRALHYKELHYFMSAPDIVKTIRLVGHVA